MFMRYRGGGIGHKYMRAIEEKYENMSRERGHHKVRKRNTQMDKGTPMDVIGEGEGGSGVNHSQANQDPGPDTSDEASEGEAFVTFIEAILDDSDDNDDDDDEYIPDLDLGSDSSGTSDSDDLYSDEDDEGYESYGLADF